MTNRKVIELKNTKDILDKMVLQVLERVSTKVEDLVVIGIKTGGAMLAKKLSETLIQKTGIDHPLGLLDITLYRDDIGRSFSQPIVKTTEINFNISEKWIILVDDVIFTGRTIRAALDSIMDLGRPSCVTLAVLVDRGHRELPIHPDIVGMYIETSYQECIDVVFKEDGTPWKIYFK